jgi:hypothetical protein
LKRTANPAPSPAPSPRDPISSARAIRQHQARLRRGVVPPANPEEQAALKSAFLNLVNDPGFVERTRGAEEKEPRILPVLAAIRAIKATTMREKIDVYLQALGAWRYPDDQLHEERGLLDLKILVEFLDEQVRRTLEAQAPVFEALWIAHDAAEGEPATGSV